MMKSVFIREAQPTDIASIAILCDQLGYPASPDEVRTRLQEINKFSHQVVFVAVSGQTIMGWIQLYACPLLTGSIQAMIAGLIIHGDYRSQGLGRQLVLRAEEWGTQQDCEYLAVFTNITRNRAHKFYLDLGFENIKTEHLLRKKL